MATTKSSHTARPYATRRTPPVDRPYATTRTPPVARPYATTRTPPVDRPYATTRTPPVDRPYATTRTPPVDRPYATTRTPPVDRPYATTRNSTSLRPYTKTRSSMAGIPFSISSYVAESRPDSSSSEPYVTAIRTPHRANVSGMSIKDFELIKILGEGSFGVTYSARHIPTGKLVAIKAVDILKSIDKGVSINKIRKEVETLKNMSKFPRCHPNIVCYYDSFEDILDARDTFFIVSELIEGKDLYDYIRDLPDYIDPVLAWNIMYSLVDALAYVHSKGYAHRDIKPENIMITDDGVIKLIDFGLACFSTSCYQGAGTKIYLPVEFFSELGEDSLRGSQAHDVWSLGVTLYRLTNLEYPFYFDTVLERKNAIKLYSESYIPSHYPFGTPKYPNYIINYLIDEMLVINWLKRPTIYMLAWYMNLENAGCNYKGQVLNRTQIINVLDDMGENVDEILYDNMPRLCSIYKSSR